VKRERLRGGNREGEIIRCGKKERWEGREGGTREGMRERERERERIYLSLYDIHQEIPKKGLFIFILIILITHPSPSPHPRPNPSHD
jgi:hypothetical protein